MASLTFFGGVSEIGGNKILLEAESGERIFLDFGKSFSFENQYFDFPLDKPFYIPDLLNIKALPEVERLPGLYRNTPGTDTLIDGVLLSHAHMDHYGYIPLLNNGTRVFLGEDTLNIVEIRDETYDALWDRKKDHLNFETFRTGDEKQICDLRFKPIHVDHSVPAAYGFIIYADGKTIAYTGDLRMHGFKSELTKDFITALEGEEKIDAMICEGTNVAPEGEDTFIREFEAEFVRRMGEAAPERVKIECETEADVQDNMLKAIEDSKGLVIVETSPVDIDRIRTIWGVACKSGREFVMDTRQAYIIHHLGERSRIQGLPPTDKCSLYLHRLKKRKNQRETDAEDEEEYTAYRKTWQQELVEIYEGSNCNVIWGPDLRENLCGNADNTLICTNDATSVLTELRTSSAGKSMCCNFILSKSEPFSEDMVLTFDKLLHWLALYDVKKYHQIHVSGHCSQDDLKSVIEAVNPKTLYPVHTKYPEMFKEFHGNVIIPEKAKKIDL